MTAADIAPLASAIAHVIPTDRAAAVAVHLRGKSPQIVAPTFALLHALASGEIADCLEHSLLTLERAARTLAEIAPHRLHDLAELMAEIALEHDEADGLTTMQRPAGCWA